MSLVTIEPTSQTSSFYFFILRPKLIKSWFHIRSIMSYAQAWKPKCEHKKYVKNGNNIEQKTAPIILPIASISLNKCPHEV